MYQIWLWVWTTQFSTTISQIIIYCTYLGLQKIYAGVVLIGEHFPSFCYHDFRLRLHVHVNLFEHVILIKFNIVLSSHSFILDSRLYTTTEWKFWIKAIFIVMVVNWETWYSLRLYNRVKGRIWHMLVVSCVSYMHAWMSTKCFSWFLVRWKNTNLGLVSNDCVTSRGLHRIKQPNDTGRLVALLNTKDKNSWGCVKTSRKFSLVEIWITESRLSHK